MKTNKTNFFVIALVISILLASIVFAEPKSLRYNQFYSSASSPLSGYATAIPPNPNIGGNAIEVQPDPSKSPTFVVKENGWVGIGTQSPNSSLHVKTSAGQLKVSEGGSNSVNLTVRNNADDSYGSLVSDAANYWWQISGSTKMVLDDSGRLGVGTTSPQSKLSVSGGDVSLDNGAGLLSNQGASFRTGSGGRTWFVKPADATAFMFGVTNSTDGSVFLIDPTGKIGVGTNAPLQKMQLESDGATSVLTRAAVDSTASGGFMNQKSRGTLSAPSAPLKEDNLLTLGGGGYDGSNWLYNKGVFFVRAGENWSTVSQGSYLSFETTLNGGTTRTEKMRITDDGKVGIGSSNPGQLLELSKDDSDVMLRFHDPGQYWYTMGINRARGGTFYISRGPIAGIGSQGESLPDFSMNPNTGNIGMGVDNSQAKLEVAGKVKASEGIIVGTNATNTKNGITLYDKVTGAPNCITIESGSLAVEPGVACA